MSVEEVKPVLLPATHFLHNGTIGDVIACVPGLNEVYRKNGKKVTLLLVNGQTPTYYPGAVHPTRDENGNMVMLNREMINKLIPLLKYQKCFKDVREWQGEPIHIDLNKIRETNVGMPNFCLSRWYFYVWPAMACDLTKKWLQVPSTKKDLAKGKIIISRTERYTNPNISYSFLKKYEHDLLFIGTELEHTIFTARFGLKFPRLVVSNFLELAQAIKQSRFHLSNQTMAFQISQGIKHPRIVELCVYAPNVLVIGADAYDFMAQASVEGYVDELYKKYK